MIKQGFEFQLKYCLKIIIQLGFIGCLVVSCGSKNNSRNETKNSPQAKNPPPATPSPQETIDYSQVKNTGIYMVPKLETRNALEKIHPGNQYFSLWGGPHATLTGFVRIDQGDLKKISKDLLSINLKGHQPSAWNQTGSGQLILAHFKSDKMDDAAKLLKKYQHPKIKSNWHVTLGYKNKLSSQEASQMRSLLTTCEWEWMIAMRMNDGRIQWVTPETI